MKKKKKKDKPKIGRHSAPTFGEQKYSTAQHSTRKKKEQQNNSNTQTFDEQRFA